MMYVVYKDASGLWRWQLVVEDTQIVARSSGGFETERLCMASIALVKASSTAQVVRAR